jgi:hypothetical protein
MVWYRWMDGPDAKALERAIHKRYRGTNCHAHGEWYYMNTATAIDLIAREIQKRGMFSISEKWSAYVERPWDDPCRD